jgi:hypothetical protein
LPRLVQCSIGVTPSTHPVDVGQRSEAAILAAFVERGIRWAADYELARFEP